MYDNLHHHFEFLKPDNIPESFKYTVFDTLIEEDIQGYGNRTSWPEDYHLHETDRLLSLLENVQLFSKEHLRYLFLLLFTLGADTDSDDVKIVITKYLAIQQIESKLIVSLYKF